MKGDWVPEALEAEGGPWRAQSLTARLRGWIREGRLAAGSRMPSSRLLCARLAIGRNMVLDVYAQLEAEGYLESRPGSGTYVTSAFALVRSPSGRSTASPGLSQRGHDLQAGARLPTGLVGAFAPGVPELARFPHALWQRLLARQQRQAPPDWRHYRHDGGLACLRQALADYLGLARGVRCTPDQIVIVPGAQAGLALCARMLSDPGEVAWVEEPGYAGAHAAMREAALQCCPVRVDAEGMQPSAALPVPRLIYLTPSHQYPTGVVMPLARRLALLDTARRHGAWIIEDDYDSEFRYHSAPLPAMQGLDEDGRVLYVGTFSKVMYPDLRMAYLVVPPGLAEAFRETATRHARAGQYPVQAALAEFLEAGHLARHVRAMRELYWQRQQLLRHIVEPRLGEALRLSSGEAGLHLLAHLPEGVDADALSRKAAAESLWLRPLSSQCLLPDAPRGLVLGYAGVEETALRTAALRLCALVSEALSGQVGLE